MAYARARSSWADWPQTSTLVRAQDLEKWDQKLLELTQTGIFNVLDRAYGADSTGTNDSAAAITTALTDANSVGGGIIYIPPGTYKCSSINLVIPGDNIHIVGAGRGLTKLSQAYWPGGNVGLVDATGAIDASTVALTANAAAGDTQITITSTLGMATDDYYLLGANDGFFPSDLTRGLKGEIVHIKTVDSATKFTVYGFVRDSYTTANSASLQKLTPRKNLSVSNLDIENSVVGGSAHSSDDLVRFKACQNVAVQNVGFRYGDFAGVNLYNTLDATVSRCAFRDFNDDSANNQYGYGVYAQRASENLVVSNCVFERMRHGFTANGDTSTTRGVPRNFNIVGNAASECTHACYDTHEGCADGLFAGNVAANSKHAGFQIRSKDTRVIGNEVTACAVGLQLWSNALNAEVRSNSFRRIYDAPTTADEIVYTGAGIVVHSGADGSMILDNTIDDTYREGVYFFGSSSNLDIHNNVIRDTGRNGASNLSGVGFAAGLTITGLTITRNQGRNRTGHMDWLVKTPVGVSASRVDGNRSYGATSGCATDAGGNTLTDNTTL